LHDGGCAIKDELEVNSQGGKQSKLNARYDLLPPNAIQRVAEVQHVGAVKYDKNGVVNYINIPSSDHLNHALGHVMKHQQGDTSEDHAGHAVTMMLLWLEMLIRESEE
jgi:hypothetical protein